MYYVQVGVVVLDKEGRVASSVSSGGIALKQPGRVGQAAVFGCGCWAQRGCAKQSSYTVGISTTGCGEHLVRTFLARECAQHLRASKKPLNALQEVMKEKFAESDFLGKSLIIYIHSMTCLKLEFLYLAGVPEKLGGAICMHYDQVQGRGDFLWTHTTASMGIAYQTTADASATTVMSRIKDLPKAGTGTTCILVESVPFTTKRSGAASNGHCFNGPPDAAMTDTNKIQSAKA